ncbi:MAG TPA: AI-2E family transporter [Syntrophales bacterium]|jgi:predicted PurR-regulated permease PerM|nr:AI-2E family transporter [Syntrophales bacterium]HON23977.1 AI-2E family transporter [Syntrophales bacterium]HOU78096.1 AI-2E family transporter [Syntrophales bacterium]HPC33409.1 AI-2E family transporter [Syntrophales bacterium]HQG34715.1 AI-2E family transporter [Syntrophales bacterium]
MNVERTKHVVFYVLLGVATLLLLYILKPFFYPIFWAAVLAIVFQPLQRRLGQKITSPGLAAAATLAAIVLIIIVPAGLIGGLLLNESLHVYNSLNMESARIEMQIEDLVKRIAADPYLRYFHIDMSFVTENTATLVKKATGFIFTSLSNLTQNTIMFLLNFVIMLYTLFFFLRDGDRFVRMIVRLIPLGAEREGLLLERFTAMTMATLKVTLIIGGLKGLLGSIVFSLTGVHGALTWGVLMVFTSIIPAVGCAIVWGPVGVVMILMGQVWEGLIILVCGLTVISHVDTFLRPVLVGQAIRMHTLLIFLSTLGGLSLFGISGFVIGPVIVSLAQTLWEIHDELWHQNNL